MSAEQPQRAFELFLEIKSQNDSIISKLDELLSETKEVKRINDEQLDELKRRGPPQ